MSQRYAVFGQWKIITSRLKEKRLFQREWLFRNVKQSKREAFFPGIFTLPLLRTRLIIPFTVTGERVVSRTLRLI